MHLPYNRYTDPPNPELAILNLGIEGFPPEFRIVVTHILLAARLLLTRNWKSNTVPSVTEVLEVTQTNYTFESLLAGREGRRAKFDNQWKPWTEWFQLQ